MNNRDMLVTLIKLMITGFETRALKASGDSLTELEILVAKLKMFLKDEFGEK